MEGILPFSILRITDPGGSGWRMVQPGISANEMIPRFQQWGLGNPQDLLVWD